ncbi:MAG: helix-hairpin-helix domain-containing protein [Chitinophagaceae bacterium]|nr:MAG: helix-hairpin-helix domain-containing protein [Chitinophagaceae bacterium]
MALAGSCRARFCVYHTTYLPVLQRPKAWIRNFFGFSQRETNGFLYILLFMGLCLVAAPLYKLTFPEYDAGADQQLLEEIVAQLETDSAENLPKYPAAKPEIIAGKLPTSSFDPNLLSAEEWQKMGLPAKIAQRIKNYQAKGGSFKVKEDVGKIYGFSEELYQKLYPLLAIPDRETFLAERNASRYPKNEPRSPAYSTSRSSYATNRKAPLQLFDINKADTTQLMRIRGIGSKRAQWIINRRDKLGGFYSINQVSEVFGLDSAVVDSVQKYTFVAPDFSPKPIYINTITVDDLGRHPYFDFKIAKAIVAYRAQHGNFRKPEDLLKVKLVKPEVLQKARPYLEF